MRSVFLSIGSNIQPEKNVPECLRLLKEAFVVKKTSSVYIIAPVGVAGKNHFWNLAVESETNLPPETLSKSFKKMEATLGRVRDPNNRCAPRTIDIDLLPEPNYQTLAFVIIPLAEISPETRDPQTGKTFRELAAICSLSLLDEKLVL